MPPEVARFEISVSLPGLGVMDVKPLEIPRVENFSRARLAGAPSALDLHFTPTSASWLNAVENFFSKMTRQRIRRGVFRSIVDLQTAINAYLAEHNASPKPFVWTQSAEAFLAKLDPLPVTSL